MGVGEAIRTRRVKRYFTLPDMRAMTGLLEEEIVAIESDAHEPSCDELARIADALDVAVDSLKE